MVNDDGLIFLYVIMELKVQTSLWFMKWTEVKVKHKSKTLDTMAQFTHDVIQYDKKKGISSQENIFLSSEIKLFQNVLLFLLLINLSSGA